MPTPDQLAALRAAAEAAHQPGVFWYQQDILERFTKQFTGAEADARYISAVSPAVVLALVDHIDAQVAELAQAHAARREAQLREQQANEARNRVAVEIRRELGARIAYLQRDAARYRWLTQDAHIGECFTEQGIVLEICGTDREIPVFHERSTDRDEVDAAIDAAMALQCTS